MFVCTIHLLMLIKELCRYATLSLHPSEDDQSDKIGRPLACKGILIGISRERYWDEEDEDEEGGAVARFAFELIRTRVPLPRASPPLTPGDIASKRPTSP